MVVEVELHWLILKKVDMFQPKDIWWEKISIAISYKWTGEDQYERRFAQNNMVCLVSVNDETGCKSEREIMTHAKKNWLNFKRGTKQLEIVIITFHFQLPKAENSTLGSNF